MSLQLSITNKPTYPEGYAVHCWENASLLRGPPPSSRCLVSGVGEGSGAGPAGGRLVYRSLGRGPPAACQWGILSRTCGGFLHNLRKHAGPRSPGVACNRVVSVDHNPFGSTTSKRSNPSLETGVCGVKGRLAVDRKSSRRA